MLALFVNNSNSSACIAWYNTRNAVIINKAQTIVFNYDYNTFLIDITSEKMILSITYVIFSIQEKKEKRDSLIFLVLYDSYSDVGCDWW